MSPSHDAEAAHPLDLAPERRIVVEAQPVGDRSLDDVMVVRWDQSRVAVATDVSIETVKRLEKMEGPLVSVRVNTIDTIGSSPHHRCG